MNIVLSALYDIKYFNEIETCDLESINVYKIPIKNNLYNIYYKLSPDAIFVHLLEIDEEIKQFAQEFEHDCKVYCYCPYTVNASNYNVENTPHIHYVTHHHIDKLDAQHSLPKNLVNKSNLDKISKEKNDQIVCFLDDIANPSYKENLQHVLYPNKQKYKIKLFNDASFRHPQNLGYVNHKSKLDLLGRSKYVINHQSSDYFFDAQYLGCQAINISDIKTNNIEDYIDDNSNETDTKNIHEYCEYLTELLIK